MLKELFDELHRTLHSSIDNSQVLLIFPGKTHITVNPVTCRKQKFIVIY